MPRSKTSFQRAAAAYIRDHVAPQLALEIDFDSQMPHMSRPERVLKYSSETLVVWLYEDGATVEPEGARADVFERDDYDEENHLIAAVCGSIAEALQLDHDSTPNST